MNTFVVCVFFLSFSHISGDLLPHGLWMFYAVERWIFVIMKIGSTLGIPEFEDIIELQ